ncbi:MAG: PilZ domain-containing protein [Burkholderiaceae bacterium]
MKETFASPPQVEARREQRYRVYWRANLHLSGERTIDARLSDISGDGLGLLASEAVPMGTVLSITMGVPDADGGPQLMAVQCKLRVVNVVLSGSDYRLGAIWVSPSANVRQVIDNWIRKLRYTSSVIGSS